MLTSKWAQGRRVPPEGTGACSHGGLFAMALREDSSPETLARPLPCICPLRELLFPVAAACLAPCDQNVPKLLMLSL